MVLTKKSNLLKATVVKKDIETVLSWCRKSRIAVEYRWNLPSAGLFVFDKRRILVCRRFNLTNRLVIILHECGHYLVGCRRRRYSAATIVRPRTRTEAIDVFLATLDEEQEAWHRARMLRDRLRLSVSDKEFDDLRRRLLMTYTIFDYRK